MRPPNSEETPDPSFKSRIENLTEDARAGPLSRFEPATYRILISGVLPPSWAPFVHDLEITQEESIANCPATRLTGELPDQAALVGVLNRLYDLGFSLLMVECLSFKELEPDPNENPSE